MTFVGLNHMTRPDEQVGPRQPRDAVLAKTKRANEVGPKVCEDAARPSVMLS